MSVEKNPTSFIFGNSLLKFFKKEKKKTIKVLKEEYPQIDKAIGNLQSKKTKVTRENIVTELLQLYETDEVTLDEYMTAKNELVE